MPERTPHSVPPRNRRFSRTRDVVVTAREHITEHMLRVTLGGTNLTPVVHDSPGAWVKLFVPHPSGEGEHSRAYTIRSHDPFRDEISIDVFLHVGGVMSDWARSCHVGEPARVGGPRSSGAPNRAATELALFGDETALPAISAILERELHQRHGRPVRAAIELSDPRDEQELRAPQHAGITWLHRGHADAPGALLAEELLRFPVSTGTGVWFSAEAHAVQSARRRLRERDLEHLHFQGYWRDGVSDYREKQEGQVGGEPIQENKL